MRTTQRSGITKSHLNRPTNFKVKLQTLEDWLHWPLTWHKAPDSQWCFSEFHLAPESCGELLKSRAHWAPAPEFLMLYVWPVPSISNLRPQGVLMLLWSGVHTWGTLYSVVSAAIPASTLRQILTSLGRFASAQPLHVT